MAFKITSGGAEMSDVIQSLLDETFAIEHYGVKGQKWGQRNYQNPDGTYTELGKERRRVGHKKTESADDESEGKIGGKAYKDMSRSERRAAKRKARHNEAERRERREFNRDKAEAIKSGNLEFINKNISKFSNDEIMEAADRYKRMQMIKDMQRAEKEAQKRDHEALIDKGIRFLKKASDATDSLTNIYNRINQSQQNKVNLEKAKVQLDDAKLSYDKNADPKKYKTEKYLTEVELKEIEAKTKRAEADLKKAKNDIERDEIDLKNKRKDLAKNEYEKQMKRLDTEMKEIDKEHKEAEKTLQYLNNSYIKDQNYWKAQQEEWKAKNPEKANNNNNNNGGKKKKNKNNNIIDDDSDNEDYYTTLADQYWLNSYFSGSQKKSLISKILGSDKIKDYESYKPSKNRTYELEDLNKESQKAIKKIAKEKPTDKFGDYAQDKQWTKDMKKHDSRYIDKWVEDMKKKYMKERNMDAKAAEAKAEEYVDAWIDAYDEGRILV